MAAFRRVQTSVQVAIVAYESRGFPTVLPFSHLLKRHSLTNRIEYRYHREVFGSNRSWARWQLVAVHSLVLWFSSYT
jgi:hypothetical protein